MSAVDDLTELQAAIFNYMWTTDNAFKTLCLGGLHHDEVPRDKDETYPNAFYFFPSVIYDRDSCSKRFDAIVQFTFNHNDKDVTKINQLIAEFDDRFQDCEASLSMTNFTVISVDRINVRPPRRSIADRFVASRDYKISIDRN